MKDKQLVVREKDLHPARIGTEETDFPAMLSMADTLIQSGFLPQAIQKPAQAVAIILTGRELGIPAMQALRQINVIQGKPTMGAELMLFMAYKNIPGFKFEVVESTTTKCSCKFERPGQVPFTHKFDMADAKALKLDGKDNWIKQPATMLRWRCISSGLRLMAPDAIAGVYTPEEAESDPIVEAPTELEPTTLLVDQRPHPKVDEMLRTGQAVNVPPVPPEPEPAPKRKDVGEIPKTISVTPNKQESKMTAPEDVPPNLLKLMVADVVFAAELKTYCEEKSFIPKGGKLTEIPLKILGQMVLPVNWAKVVEKVKAARA